MSDQPQDPSAEPPVPPVEQAKSDVREAWIAVSELLIDKRAQRDRLADEIRQLVIDEDLLRQANNVFEKRKGSR